jgi:hypothetical protein
MVIPLYIYRNKLPMAPPALMFPVLQKVPRSPARCSPVLAPAPPLPPRPRGLEKKKYQAYRGLGTAPRGMALQIQAPKRKAEAGTCVCDQVRAFN